MSLLESNKWASSSIWIIKQTGWMIRETQKYFVIADKYNPQGEHEDQYADLTKIPKTWILKKKRIVISSF
jgi:hypothetical protein